MEALQPVPESALQSPNGETGGGRVERGGPSEQPQLARSGSGRAKLTGVERRQPAETQSLRKQPEHFADLPGDFSLSHQSLAPVRIAQFSLPALPDTQLDPLCLERLPACQPHVKHLLDHQLQPTPNTSVGP